MIDNMAEFEAQPIKIRDGQNLLKMIDLFKCRLCYRNPGEIEINSNEKLATRILLCTKIDVSTAKEDGVFPKAICMECFSIIDKFFNFQLECYQVNKLLEEIINGNATEKKLHVSLLESPKNLLESSRHKFGDARQIERHKFNLEENKDVILEPPESNDCKDETANDFFDANYSSDEEIKPEPPLKYKCSYCAKYYTRKFRLQKHIDLIHKLSSATLKREDETEVYSNDSSDETRETTKKFQCDEKECGKTFPRKIDLKKHRVGVHDLREYLCPICGKNFQKLAGLKSHEKIHASIKEYTCGQCGMAFAQPCNLKTHIKLHHEGHRFYCTKCGKAFLTNVAMKRHELLHVGVKDFKCDKCKAAFYTRRELIKHGRYHTGVRSYFCNFCYRSYIEKHHLTIHMRVHTGERPYKCDVTDCNKSFMESQKLRRHKKNVHRLEL